MKRTLEPTKRLHDHVPLMRSHKRTAEDSRRSGSLVARAFNLLNQIPGLVIAVAGLQFHISCPYLERFRGRGFPLSEQPETQRLVHGLLKRLAGLSHGGFQLGLNILVQGDGSPWHTLMLSH